MLTKAQTTSVVVVRDVAVVTGADAVVTKDADVVAEEVRHAMTVTATPVSGKPSILDGHVGGYWLTLGAVTLRSRPRMAGAVTTAKPSGQMNQPVMPLPRLKSTTSLASPQTLVLVILPSRTAQMARSVEMQRLNQKTRPSHTMNT